MRLFHLLIVVLIFSSEPAFAQARFPFTGETVTERVNVRAGQNNNFESVALLSKGSTLVVLGKNFNWFKVFLPEKSKAYVKSAYVKFLTAEIGEALVDHLNVRAAPNTEATTLGQLKQGQKFFIEQKQNDWVWIQPVDGIYGWVNDTLLVYKNEAVLEKPRRDPDVAASVKEQEARAAQARQSAKTALLRKVSNDLVECSGVLAKASDKPGGYRVLRDNATVCYVDGPQSVLEGYLGSSVHVKGQLKSVPADLDAGIVLLSKINLDI